MLNPWSNEIWRLLAFIGLGILLGRIFQSYSLMLLLAMSAYAIYHLYHIYKLYIWLSRYGLAKLPNGHGIWSEIYIRIFRMQQRNRRRKQRLVEILNRFKESTDAIPDAAVVLNANWEIEWINKAASTLLSLRSPADLGQRINNFIRHPSFTKFINRFDFSKSVEIPAPAAENIMISIVVVPYGNDQRLLICRDVTQIHKLEQVRRDFVANASHELRTPLTVLTGLVETLDENEVEEKDRVRAIKLMRQQSNRMQQIVDDLLLLTHLESNRAFKPEPVSIPALIHTLVEDAKALSGDQQHAIKSEIDEDLWMLGVEKELSSAFMNLMSNAVRYTPQGGEITIRWQRTAKGAQFQVEDSGIGIDPKHISRLTERFYRVDVGRSRSTGGTGLGLAIVKHVLDRCGGKLQVRSEPGAGSIFSCEFPENLLYSPKKHAI